MFAAARFVRDHCRLDPIANHVAMVIVSFSRRDGSAPCSLRQIAAATGYHTHTCQLAVGRLEEAGILAVDRRRGRGGNSFRFPVVDLVELSTGARARRAQYGTDSRREMRAQPPGNARGTRAHLESEHLKETRALQDAGWHFVPGTGWSAPFEAQGAVNQ